MFGHQHHDDDDDWLEMMMIGEALRLQEQKRELQEQVRRLENEKRDRERDEFMDSLRANANRPPLIVPRPPAAPTKPMPIISPGPAPEFKPASRWLYRLAAGLLVVGGLTLLYWVYLSGAH